MLITISYYFMVAPHMVAPHIISHVHAKPNVLMSLDSLTIDIMEFVWSCGMVI